MTDSVKVLIFVESRYRVDRKRVKSVVLSVLEEQSVKSPLEVSIAIVGDRKMKALNTKFRQKETTTNILSFPLSEGDSTRLPKDILRLGDIVISYPQLIRESAAEEMLIDDRMEELVRHGMLHLLGLHHE
jgi:probable rRNA maturation factor